MTSSSWREHTKQQISKWRAKRREIAVELEDFDSRIKAFEEALRVYDEEHGINDEIDVRELKGKSMQAALVYIARKGGGRVRVRDAWRLLVDAGIYGGARKNASAAVYTKLRSLDQFDRVAPGIFQLTDKNVRADHVRPVDFGQPRVQQQVRIGS